MLSATSYKTIYRMYFINSFRKFSRQTSLGVYRNYCLFTYSGRVVFRKFKLSRHVFKSMASKGFLCGFRKSSF